MKLLENIRKNTEVPKDLRKEFNGRNYKFNNIAFSAFTVFSLPILLLAVFLNSYRKEGSFSEIFSLIWVHFIAVAAVAAAVFSGLLIIRKKFPQKMWLSDVLAVIFYTAVIGFFIVSNHLSIPFIKIKNTNIFIILFFMPVFFSRFDLKVTLSMLTAYLAAFIVFLVIEKPLLIYYTAEDGAGALSNFAQSLAGLIAAYIMAALGAFVIWTMRIKSFMGEKNLEALLVSDFLTNVHNRRGFDFMLEKFWDDAYKNGGRVTLYMIDIDHFKRYNDIYGHVEGDKCLKIVAQTIAEAMRKGDYVARYGGEEFVALLRNTQRADEERIGTRILDKVASKALKHENSVMPYVTISIGCAWSEPSRGGQSRAELIRKADEALYKAKQNGRNTVVYYEDM